MGEIGHALGPLVGRHHVQLIEHQPARFVGQLGVVGGQLGQDGLRALHRVAVVKRRHVHQMQQQTGTLQVAQKLVPQTGALRGAFDEAWHIGHDKTLLGGHAYHPQVGVQGGKRVVGHLGARVGDRCN